MCCASTHYGSLAVRATTSEQWNIQFSPLGGDNEAGSFEERKSTFGHRRSLMPGSDIKSECSLESWKF
ncbi:unnamed protein product [Linum trigynum]|uniref:Uncharacterized protein n=1 Tax=Linum trigynum TaxID=586398 RepID=A0AAV2FCT7_9ROSI